MKKPKPKKPKPKKPPKPRNVAAKALGMGQFQPKVEADPNVYKRREKHRPDLAQPPEGEGGDNPEE
ncbi:MAG TPA: hypothetical protein PK286_02850 [Devosia sp.]|nr:hypothetical protein [Devosia sp.]